MGVGDLCLAGEHETIDGARTALTHLGQDHAAALLDRAIAHWNTHHGPALARDEWPDDDVRLVDQELDQEWLELRDEAHEMVDARIEATM